jgi:hypothetical protein
MKKAIKKVMHRRPKKKRPSDINRNNVNLNVCITKYPFKHPDYDLEDDLREFQYLSFVHYTDHLFYKQHQKNGQDDVKYLEKYGKMIIISKGKIG